MQNAGEETLSSNGTGYTMPTSVELSDFFNEFINKWAKLNSEYFSWPGESPDYLPLEEGVFFSEPFKGLLVLRSSKDFGAFLEEENTGSQKEEHKRMGLFVELAVLFWHKFAQRFLKVDSRRVTPAILRACVPVNWPDRKPQSACVVFINGFPLEIRLWTDVTEEEIQNWKMPRS